MMSIQKNEIWHQPPVLNPISDDKNVSSVWERYFTNQRQAFTQFHPIVTLKDTNGISQVSLPMAPSLTTDEINNLQNVSNGMYVYNSTTGKFNFRESGAWVEKQNV